MNNRYNQVRDKIIRAHGKGDEVDLIAVASLLRGHNVSFHQEPYILLDKQYGSLCHIGSTLTKEQVEKFIVHHPDFILILKEKFVILEIDGTAHRRKSARTDERNWDYTQAKLDFIVVTKEDLEELKIDMFDYIREQLRNRGIID